MKKNKLKFNKSVLTILVFIGTFFIEFFLSRFVSRKITLVSVLFFIFVYLIICIVAHYLKKGVSDLLGIPLTFYILSPIWGSSIVFLLISCIAYDFVKESFVPFWEISLVISIVTVAFIMRKYRKKDKKIALFGVGLFAVLIVSSAIISHLNYVLDFSEPQHYSATIEEKVYTSLSLKAFKNEFKITESNDTFYIRVDLIDYYKYEVGDTYNFSKFNGAFGKEFYLSE